MTYYGWTLTSKALTRSSLAAESVVEYWGMGIISRSPSTALSACPIMHYTLRVCALTGLSVCHHTERAQWGSSLRPAGLATVLAIVIRRWLYPIATERYGTLLLVPVVGSAVSTAHAYP